jgi:hypothetical protein
MHRMVDGLHPVEPGAASGRAVHPPLSSPPKLYLVDTAHTVELPSMPPVEVLDALDKAARVLHELDQRDVKLRIDHDETTNTVKAHVQEGGAPERELSLGRLLNVLAGDTASLASKRTA